eukprot:m.25077 g.25077  ORF g.25077 m.25077 type:complete len:539 (-) comp4209_c0_seq1:129-1745(-)
MSYYGKAAADPDYMEAWQTQLDAIRDILSITSASQASLSERGVGSAGAAVVEDDPGGAAPPAGNPIALRRSRVSKPDVGSQAASSESTLAGAARTARASLPGRIIATDPQESVRAARMSLPGHILRTAGPRESDGIESDARLGASTAGSGDGNELSDVERDQFRFVQWLRERHEQEWAAATGATSVNHGAQMEAAQLESLRRDRRRSSLERGELERRSASPEEHVRRFSFHGNCVSTINAHDDAVNSIITLQNGRVVTGSEDTLVKVWNPNSAELITTLTGHTSGVNCLAELAGPNLVASGSDREIRVWDIDKRTSLTVLKGHGSYVWGLTTVDGLLVSVSADKTVRLWCVERDRPEFGECFAVLEEHRDSVYSIAKFPDERTMATGSADTTVIMWKKTGQSSNYVRSTVLRGHTKLVYALIAVGPTYLASASDDWTIRLWDCVSGNCLGRLDGHEGAVTSLAAFLGPDGSQVPILFSGSRDCDAKLWDLTTMSCQRTLAGHRDEVLCITVLVSTHHCGVLATGCEDGTVKIWGIVQA